MGKDPSRGVQDRCPQVLRKVFQHLPLPSREAELPLRAQEDLRVGDEDSPKESQEVQLHQGLQGAAQGDLRPVCDMEERLACKYIPKEQCQDEAKQYCYKVEEVVVEEVCDMKFDTSYL